MKRLTFAGLLFFLSSTALAYNLCVEVPETCSTRGELPGCEGGYKGYSSTELEFFTAGYSPSQRDLAFRTCLEKLNDPTQIEKKLHCQEIPETCSTHGEIIGCEGGYRLLEVQTGSFQYFPRASLSNALAVCQRRKGPCVS